MAKRPKKHQYEENLIDELSEDFDTFETWFINNWKLVAAGAGLVVVALSVYLIATFSIKHQEEKVYDEFAMTNSKDEIKAFIEKHPKSRSVYPARARLAGMYIAEKDYDSAISELDKIVKSGADAYIRERSSITIAYCLEEQGKIDEALQKFDSLASTLQTKDLQAEAAYAAGRLYADKGELNKAYDLLIRLDPELRISEAYTIWAQKSRSILNRIPANQVDSVKPAPAPVLTPEPHEAETAG